MKSPKKLYRILKQLKSEYRLTRDTFQDHVTFSKTSFSGILVRAFSHDAIKNTFHASYRTYFLSTKIATAE